MEEKGQNGTWNGEFLISCSMRCASYFMGTDNNMTKVQAENPREPACCYRRSSIRCMWLLVLCILPFNATNTHRHVHPPCSRTPSTQHKLTPSTAAHHGTVLCSVGRPQSSGLASKMKNERMNRINGGDREACTTDDGRFCCCCCS